MKLQKIYILDAEGKTLKTVEWNYETVLKNIRFAIEVMTIAEEYEVDDKTKYLNDIYPGLSDVENDIYEIIGTLDMMKSFFKQGFESEPYEIKMPLDEFEGFQSITLKGQELCGVGLEVTEDEIQTLVFNDSTVGKKLVEVHNGIIEHFIKDLKDATNAGKEARKNQDQILNRISKEGNDAIIALEGLREEEKKIQKNTNPALVKMEVMLVKVMFDHIKLTAKRYKRKGYPEFKGYSRGSFQAKMYVEMMSETGCTLVDIIYGNVGCDALYSSLLNLYMLRLPAKFNKFGGARLSISKPFSRKLLREVTQLHNELMHFNKVA